ncbi:C-type lectin domain family 6 member A-like [Mya arenaria]|uniref:C-type lectin domain family 6 member A-like n=1 Tax=Mya arenaria TaxID=6604 RepID=UPI0022E522A2|nr:C-type lectin domain family 6 member A-like [Mya arenaria]
MVSYKRKAFLLFWVVGLHVATASEPCVDLDATGCRNNPQICQDILLAEVTCPVMCNKCPQSTQPPSCPDSWELFQGSCYYFQTDYMAFNDSEIYCNQNNGHLVHINTAAEQAFVKNKILNINPNQTWFIGLTDVQVEGVYRWVDNDEELTPSVFRGWYPTQPYDAYDSEDCVGMWHTVKMLWNDISCTQRFPSICELRVGQALVG